MSRTPNADAAAGAWWWLQLFTSWGHFVYSATISGVTETLQAMRGA